MSILELKDIGVSAGEKTLVEGVSLSVESGKIHVLMGPNGSGKSSLLNAVMGHPRYRITGGAILLDGEDITELPTDKKAKKGMFLSLQHLPEIAGVTLNSFLHRAYKELKGSDVSALEFYKVAETKAKEAGIDAGFLKKHVNSGLSGGEKKQSELLQLLTLEARFALLDEIDSGVDVDAMKKVYAAINYLKEKGIGFLIVSHHPSVLEYISPDTVSVMRGGKLALSGGKELAERIMKEGFENI
jgi:Fe-S cluster assembly ATP-binding protein